MYVLKRNGQKETVKFDKITTRLRKLSGDLKHVDPAVVTKATCDSLVTGIKTSEIDDLAAEVAFAKSTIHYDYATLAARISVSNLHKTTKNKFSDVVQDLFLYTNPKNGQSAPLISKRVHDFVHVNSAVLDAAIRSQNDYGYDYFGFRTLVKSYLLRLHGKIVERPQYMLMRVACGIHAPNLEHVLEVYRLMSERWYTHATPTLFNAGTNRPQMSSCFLLTVKDDSITGIYDTLKQCAEISKSAGGIGLSTSHVRATGSYINGTNGASNGLVPMLRVFNTTARYVDQGGGKRKGSFAIYLEPWHADIEAFLSLKRNHGAEESRARDLSYGMWIPDLFMKRVEENQLWSLFCPNEAPGLVDVYGREFEELYLKYESEKTRVRKQVPARYLYEAICKSQLETGNPYMLFKDTCNSRSNQKNLGTIRGSNLCTEIIQYSSKDEIAVCNLASVSLKCFVSEDGKSYDFQKLFEVIQVMTKSLDRIIDENFYPVKEAEYSNQRHRPIGIGVQGLADAFLAMKLPFDSPEASKLNCEIFETMYYAALDASCTLAAEKGTYSTYQGSPVSRGFLHVDYYSNAKFSGRWDWTVLRQRIARYGVRNSLLIAPMPTASTSQILGNNECFEPYTSNIYSRRTLAGEFICVCKPLVDDLVAAHLWSDDLKQKIIAAQGSIANIAEIPADIRALYKTVWEIPMKVIINMAVERMPFIDQSQSVNCYFRGDQDTSALNKVYSMHMYAWKNGLKGTYYVRTEAASNPTQVTVLPSILSNPISTTTNSIKMPETAAAAAGVCKRRKPGAPADEVCIPCSG